MTKNLVQLIVDQFLDIVEKLSKKACFEYNYCDFEYRVGEGNGYRFIDIIYIRVDECGRHHNVVAQIDITNICYEDLVCHWWVSYLEKIAKTFIHDICPKKYIIVKKENKGCRPQPPKWCPAPCKITTTIYKKVKPICPEPEVEVIVEEECPCIKTCIREECCEPEHVIIRYEQPKISCCGCNLILKESPRKKKHDFKSHSGNIDFNHHKWKKCCSD